MMVIFTCEWTTHIELLNMQLSPAVSGIRTIDQPLINYAAGAYLPWAWIFTSLVTDAHDTEVLTLLTSSQPLHPYCVQVAYTHYSNCSCKQSTVYERQLHSAETTTDSLHLQPCLQVNMQGVHPNRCMTHATTDYGFKPNSSNALILHNDQLMPNEYQQ